MHSFILPAGNLDLITIAGPDAVKLLQGQLTCDVDALTDPGFVRGALCNNKGRVLATLVLVRQGSVFYLAMNKGLGSVLTTALKKYLPFYKCELKQIAPHANVCFGMVGEKAVAIIVGQMDLLPEANQCANLADGWICALGQGQQYLVCSNALLTNATLTQGVTTGSLTDWLLAGMQSGQFPFLPEDAEKYTPQELHLDRHGYISFTKGCYTGQEIVARMHYRGTLKKMLFLLEAPSFGMTVPDKSMDILNTTGGVLGKTIKILQSHSGALSALATLPAEVEHSVPAYVTTATGLRFNQRPF